jgi:enoyl-CoA hydratase
MVLPRWAVELAQERLSKRHVQDATVGARIYDPDGAADAGFLDSVVPPDALAGAATAEAQRWAGLPRDAYRGQVRMCRGDRLGRLSEAIAADRGRAFGTPGA